MQIRKLQESDADAYYALVLRGLKEHPEAFGTAYEEMVSDTVNATVERLRRESTREDEFLLGAFDEEGNICGVLSFRRAPWARMLHKANAGGMYVTPEARGKGVGKALLEEAIRRARQLPGLSQINLSVNANNQTARNLYLSLGFVPYGIEPRGLKVDNDFYDLELMVLRID